MHKNLCSWYRLLICLYDKQTSKQTNRQTNENVREVFNKSRRLIWGCLMKFMRKSIEKNLDFYILCAELCE